MARFLFSISFALAMLPGLANAATATDDTLERASALAKGGAPHLALQVLQAGEPPVKDTRRWIAFEQRRLMILRLLKDWDAIAKRADNLPADLPGDFHRAMLFEAAEAQLAAGRMEEARRYLRRLVWQHSPGVAELARAQRLVIRSYLMEDNLGDAQVALTRYREEHGRSAVWLTLHAEILLRQGNARAAFDALAGLQSYEARLLRGLAALRAKLYQPRDTLTSAEKLASELKAQSELRRRALILGAEAAGRLKDNTTRVRLLEEALAADAMARTESHPVDAHLFRADADDLWSSYVLTAEQQGNRERLVVGNDEAWYKLARRHCRKNAPLARAVHAFQTTHASTPEEREASHRRLVASLFASGQGDVAQMLYTRTSRYPKISQLPLPVRYRLADKALADYDIRLAADLIRDLKLPPPDDDDPEGWAMRRARILIYAGDSREAAVLLSGLIDKQSGVDNNFADRYLQVLFDLQTVGNHREALALLESLYGLVDSAPLQREILFWQADSQSALKNHRAAAELYLRSATHNGHSGGDPWGHTARFRAAEELGKAGLARDARDVYSRLLAVTAEPARRTVIERQIQQLWLAGRQTTRP
jgi:tetratricopeptide (TPR) repeat protein